MKIKINCKNAFDKDYVHNDMVLIDNNCHLYKMNYKIKSKILPNNIKEYIISLIDNDQEIVLMWNKALIYSLIDHNAFYKNIPIYKYIWNIKNKKEDLYIKGINIYVEFIKRNIMRATFMGKQLFTENIIGYSDIEFNDINNYFYIEYIKKSLKEDKEKYNLYKDKFNYVLID